MRRAVLFTGLTLGTCLTVLAYWNGARVAVPGMPHLIGITLGAVLVWLALAAVMTWLAELARRHHKAIAVHGWRHSKRGTIAAARVAGSGSRSAWSRLTGWAGPRWAARLPVAGGMDRALPQDAADRRDVIEDERRRANICQACGRDGTSDDPLTRSQGYRVHTSHTTDPSTGYYDPAGAPAPAPAVPAQNGAQPMTTPTTPANAGTVTAKANAPAAWKALAASTADFEPEDDGDLMAWMASEVQGHAQYGEALISVYEACVDSIGLDPVAMSAVHDVADAAAECATAMAYARQKFAAHYSEVREAVSAGLQLPFNGRWITGEGEA